MRVIEIHPEVFSKLDAQRDQRVAKEALAQLQKAMTPQWLERMESKIKGIRNTNASAAAKLKMLTDLMEEVGGLRAPHLACRSGCSACCHVLVEITDVEAARIAKRTGLVAKTFPAGRQPSSVKDFGRQDTPCPFLKDGQCSVYDVRPLACHDMAVMGPDALACSFENMALDREGDPRFLGVPEVRVGPVRDAWNAIAVARRTAVADIRQFFPQGQT